MVSVLNKFVTIGINFENYHYFCIMERVRGCANGTGYCKIKEICRL